jgi:predicted Rossmann fold flavoprotein
VENSGAILRTGQRVTDVRFDTQRQSWCVQTPQEVLPVGAVIVCSGGLALPKSGSDGAGFAWAQTAGHTIVQTTPALTPLLAQPVAHAHLSGITLPVRLKLAEKSTLAQYDGSFLFTHVGYSGPVALNISRHVARERWTQPQAQVSMRLLHEVKDGEEGRYWQEFVRGHAKQSVSNALAEILPRRVAETIEKQSGTQTTSLGRLNTQQQKAIRTALFEAPLPVHEVAGYTKAETTAGGVALPSWNRRP